MPDMSTPTMTTDFRMPTTSKWRAPRAVVDGGGRADFYRQTEWSARSVAESAAMSHAWT